MKHNPHPSLNRTLLLALITIATDARAQDVLADAPRLPTGFAQADAVSAAGPQETEIGEFSGSVGLNVMYDSNVTQGSAGGIFEEQSDMVIAPSAQASYVIQNSAWRLGGGANVTRQFFQDRDDFNATNFGFNLFGGYQSEKLVATFTSGMASSAGVNRFAGTFIEQDSYNLGFLGRYRFSTKTSLVASWNQSRTEAQTNGFGDNSSSTFGLSALWQATPLLSIGPGLRYGVRAAADNRDFTVFGPTVSANYQLSTKVKLRSAVGIDSIDSPNGGSNTAVNFSVGLSYNASEFWGANLSMIQDTQPTILGSGVDETFGIQLGFWRQIRSARASLGLSFNDRSPADSVPTTVGVREAQFLSLSAGLAMPVLRNNANLAFNLNWMDQSLGDGSRSWDGFQVGTSLQWQF